MRFSIIGTGRCGSSLLTRILNQHPEVFVFPETHWIPKMHELYGDRQVPMNDLVDVVRRTYHANGRLVTQLDEAALAERLGETRRLGVRDFCDAVGRLHADEAGKSSWADKTPDYGAHVGLLRQLWPECRFIHLIRNGAEVAVSMSGHRGFRWLASAREVWWCAAAYNRSYRAVRLRRPPLSDYTRLWALRLMRVREELAKQPTECHLEVRFEDLIARPEETLEMLSRFLDLEPGTWLQEAIQIVEPRSVRSKATPETVAQMSSQEVSLMRDLGYS